MSKIESFFNSQSDSYQPLKKEQLALLMTLGQMQQNEELNETSLEEWQQRKHPRREAVKKLKKNRTFKALLEFHSKFGSELKISYPYTLWVIGMCKRKTDVHLFHAHSIFVAKKIGETMIDLNFWCHHVCPNGFWKKADWQKRWEAQKTQQGNLLEQQKEWDAFHNQKF